MVDALKATTGLSADILADLLAELFHMPRARYGDLYSWHPAFERLPLAKAMRRGGVLLRDGEQFIGVIADPFDPDLQAYLETAACDSVHLQLASQDDLLAYFGKAEHEAKAITDTPRSVNSNRVQRADIEELSLQRISENASPTIRFVNSTLYDALKAGASDIHLEATPAGLEVRYRIDGALDVITTLPGIDLAEQAISRIKVMAELDIAERRIPQDGRFRVALSGRDIDVRVSIMPSIHGEDAVLRLLDKRNFVAESDSLRLELLGFDAESLSAVRRLVREPYGLLLVTGPTGSGKTTTLYAALSEINDRRDKIITIEDPVEYELPGILQIPVNEKKGLSFAKGLRSILRHDPDKIMVGEIRDRETAEIAVQSALTGHLVLTTVHANNVFDVFSRFSHMGIDPYALTAALNGIWAQRLVRLVCPQCAIERHPDAHDRDKLGLSLKDLGDYPFKIGTGCAHCRGSGYRGRKAIAEILTLNDHLREMIAMRQPVTAIKDEARRTGTRYLRESALSLARGGETSLEEVARVTLSA